jgi:hypothetical protein
MKLFLYGLAVLAPLFVGFQAYTTVATSNTEKRPYEVLHSEGAFEIRYYPPVNMATVVTKGNLSNRNGNFRVLAGYIFGGNEENRSIAMTSPVEMAEEGKGKSRMSFMMPTDIPMDSLPNPNDDRIKLHQSEPFYAATIRYGGWSSRDVREKKTKALREWLADMHLRPEADPIYLGYNPPYQMVNRRNEVMIMISEKALRKHPNIEI